MTIHFTPERRVPRDHLGYLIARHGWWRVVAGLVAETLRLTPAVRGHAPPVRRGRGAGGAPLPLSDHLRRDIGLPPAGDRGFQDVWR